MPGKDCDTSKIFGADVGTFPFLWLSETLDMGQVCIWKWLGQGQGHTSKSANFPITTM